MSGISPTKKRKANDSRATPSDDTHHGLQISGGGGFISSWLGYYLSVRREQSPSATSSCGGENHISQLDRMEKIMLRMEEKCNRLEAKCNSLENIVKEQVDSLDAKIDKKFKQHEYNDMLVKNQSWKYSPPVYEYDYWVDVGFDYNGAEYLSEASDKLREVTESLRQGKFPNEFKSIKSRGINLQFGAYNLPILSDADNNNLLPHWREFAAALKQFTPAFGVLPDGCESFLDLQSAHLSHDAVQLMKDALVNQPFQELYFTNDREDELPARWGMSVDAIIALVQSNKHLRKLDLTGTAIGRYDIEQICSSVHNHPNLVDLDLSNCFVGGHGDEMMTSLLTIGTLKLRNLKMSYNGITSNVSRLLSDFLATDPPLKHLELEQNQLNDNDAGILANALRSNKTLTHLDLESSSITDVGNEAFRRVLNNDSTLNSVSDSNHSCYVYLDVYHSWNMNEEYESINDLGKEREMNRGRKIYKLLSSRNKSVSNAQHFGDIDVKFLPDIVQAVQKYASFQMEIDAEDFVRELSIVYEIMRKWDKVFPLYCNPK